jgi:hypothetical protein
MSSQANPLGLDSVATDLLAPASTLPQTIRKPHLG